MPAAPKVVTSSARKRFVTTPAKLTRRAEFVELTKLNQKFVQPGFLLQYQANAEGCRYGFTASRKVGGAVQRNRAKRRLRELLRPYLKANPPFKLVLIARPATLDLPYAELQRQLEFALTRTKIIGA